MSTIVIEVAGVDRSTFLHKPSAPNWDDLLNARGTGAISFMVPYADLASFRPADGQTVTIVQDGTNRFGGFLVEPQLTDLIDEKRVLFSCGMKDNNSIADRRVITAFYVEVPFEDIVADILDNSNGDGLTGEFITSGGVAAGPALTIEFPTIYVTEAFQDLAVAAGGFWWDIGHDKDLDFGPRDQVSAPAPLTGDNTLKGTPKLRPILEKYRNVEYVLAGGDNFQVVAGFIDSVEVAARAVIEGTSGRYEHIEERQDIIDGVLAEDLAQDLVNRFGLVTLYFETTTRSPGYAAGQEVDLTFPALELSATPMLIDSVRAQVMYESEDDEDLPTIWYGVTAISGDPFGGWMEHFRKRPGPTQRRDIVPVPGVTVDCVPGVLVHDPPPGPYDWFQGPLSGAMDTGTAVLGLTHESEGNGGHVLHLIRGGVANSGGCSGGEFPGCLQDGSDCHVIRQSTFSAFPISTVDEDVSTTPDLCFSWDENDGSSFKADMVVKPDNSQVAVIERDAGSDPIFIIIDFALGKRGQVAAVGMPDNNAGFEGAWVGNFVYVPDSSTSDIWVFNVTDPDNPTLEDVFTTSLSATFSCVPSSDGSYLFVCGGSGGTRIVALDISDPSAIVEVDTTTTAGQYISIDLRGDDDMLAAFRRANASELRYLILPVTVGGGASTFGTVNEGVVPEATSNMDGRAVMFDGPTAHVFASILPVTNSLRSYTFDLNQAETAFTLTEVLSYNHGVAGNLGPIRSYIGLRAALSFNASSDTQIVFGVKTFPTCVEISTQWPLLPRFGGTGHKRYQVGDILYADGFESLARRAIGDEADILTVSAGGLPVWAPPVVPSGEVSGAVLVACMPNDVQFDSQILADIDSLALSVVSGETYYFRAELFVELDIDASHRYALGGTAEGDVRYQVRTLDDDTAAYSIVVSGQHAVLGGEAFVPSGLLSGYTEISGCIDVTADGTLVPQIALNDPLPGPASLFTEPRGYIDGMETANAADTDHDITFQPGVARSDDDLATIVNGLDITKRIDAGFSEGDAGGGLDTGSVAADTEYNLWAIAKDDATVDFLFSLSATAPTMPVDFTQKRRIGSVFTDGSSNIRAYTQQDGWFFYVDPVLDINDTGGTLGVFAAGTVSVPPNTLAALALEAQVSEAFQVIFLARQTSGSGAFNSLVQRAADDTGITRIIGGMNFIPIDGSSQFEYAINGSGSGTPVWKRARVWSQGWLDNRGEDE